jgi:hypothetical protein
MNAGYPFYREILEKLYTIENPLDNLQKSFQPNTLHLFDFNIRR